MFETSAVKIAGLMRATLQHEEDLVVSVNAAVSGNPGMTTAELQNLVTVMRVQQRYPELLGVGALAMISQADLQRFIDRLRADPGHPLGPSGTFTMVPGGVRPYYCLVQAAVGFSDSHPGQYGVDYCVSALGQKILTSRDSGSASNLLVQNENGAQLVVETPLYRDGMIPSTLEGRRANYLGSIGTSISPALLFDLVLQEDHDTTVTLSSDDAVFRNRAMVPGALTVDENLGNGWIATISGPAGAEGRLAADIVALAIAGCTASALLGALIFSLGTGRKRAVRMVASRTDELRHQALHDGLTGLPNRTLLLDRVEQLLARCQRSDTVGAALYIDLDGFKNVNDSLGHVVGDKLLQAVAARLTTSLRGVDTIGRMGGDEFVVLVENGSLDVSAEHVAERLLEVLRDPFQIDGVARPIIVSTSIGIAVGHRDAAGALLRDADIALHRAKTAGRNCFQLFRPDMETAVHHHYELESDLRSALDHDEFRLYYQPVYDLSDLSIIGTEALIRWEHPTRGLLLPDEFIPLLEATGIIVEVGHWVLLDACRQAKLWLDQGYDLTVAVNVSARQLDRDSIVDHVAGALASSGLEPGKLILEITETALMKDTELAARRLHALKKLGVQLAIDDFGTGYSSLAYLQRFPVDCLKIDRSFTEAVASSPETDALIHTLVQLGKDLGLKTLAEGVETTAQLDHLRGESVDQAQGFLFARPMSVVAFDSQLLLQPGRQSLN